MRFLLGLILAFFSAYTVWIASEFGYTSVFVVTLREPPSTQALIDLLIACSLLFFVILSDHRQKGRPLIQFIPFAIATAVAGSIGPLLYFIFYPDLLMPNKKAQN